MNLSETIARAGNLLARKSPSKRGGRIKKVGAKRAIQLKEYTKLRRAFLEERPLCEGWPVILDWAIRLDISERGTALSKIPTPRPQANQVHHKNSRIGEKLNDTKDWLAVGNWAHVWIHAHPREARVLGLLK